MSASKYSGGNPERAKAILGLRSSGAAGAHGDRRLKRLKTRASRIRQALRDQ